MTGLRRCGKPYASRDEAERSKKGRTGRYLAVPCGGGHWHLQKLVLKPIPPGTFLGAGARKDTGPSAKVRAAVLARDQHQCCSCGKPAGMPGTWWSIQHRVPRGQGGGNDLPNLVTLCGSATSRGCHRMAEDRDREMHARGYWLRSGEDPALVPIMLASEHGSGITVWLTPDGGYSVEAPGGVTA